MRRVHFPANPAEVVVVNPNRPVDLRRGPNAGSVDDGSQRPRVTAPTASGGALPKASGATPAQSGRAKGQAKAQRKKKRPPWWHQRGARGQGGSG